MLRRFAVLAVVLASLGIASCASEAESEQEGSPAAAESEALYVDLGGLKYQVQLSRQLNPRDPEDADYFRGVAPESSDLPEGDVWFGVFIRVENRSDEALPSARTFEVEDTEGNAFEPVESENVFAYEPEVVPARGFVPNQERLQAYTGTQGALLLFQLPLSSLDNRPLELAIKSPNDSREVALIDLDV